VSAITEVPTVLVELEILAPFVGAATELVEPISVTDLIYVSMVDAVSDTIAAAQADSVNSPTVTADTVEVLEIITNIDSTVPAVTAWVSVWNIESGTFAEVSTVTAETEVLNVMMAFGIVVPCVRARTVDMESLGEWGVPTPERVMADHSFRDVRNKSLLFMSPRVESRIVWDIVYD
jgi:hypothetical protein